MNMYFYSNKFSFGEHKRILSKTLKNFTKLRHMLKYVFSRCFYPKRLAKEEQSIH